VEVEIVGWMKNRQSQQIDYRVIMGDVDKDEVWKDVEGLLTTLWQRADNKKLGIRMMAVDSGYATKKVYDFVNKFSITQVIPVKGKEGLDVIFTPPRQVDITRMGKKIGTTKLYNIVVSILKSQLYGYLKQEINKETGEIPEGYCFFPKRDANYFKGMTAEELASTTNKKGHRVYQWVKKFERNEPLDCRIYASAAKAIIGADRWNNARWERELMDSGIEDNPPPAQKKEEKKKSSFWGK
jgi:phage terminase large subunit GpA-like protein